MKILYFFLYLWVLLPSWIRIRIQQLKLMRIQVDPDPQPWTICYLLVYNHLFQLPLGGGSLNNLLVDGSARHQPATKCELYSKNTVLRIRHVYPGSCLLSIPDPGSNKSTKRGGGGGENFPTIFLATNIIKL
jgi:hypothetical protein